MRNRYQEPFFLLPLSLQIPNHRSQNPIISLIHLYYRVIVHSNSRLYIQSNKNHSIIITERGGDVFNELSRNAHYISRNNTPRPHIRARADGRRDGMGEAVATTATSISWRWLALRWLFTVFLSLALILFMCKRRGMNRERAKAGTIEDGPGVEK